MADVTTPAMTAEKFFDWCYLPANVGKRFELVKGVPTPCPLSDDAHPWRCIVGVLHQYVVSRRTGSIALRGDGVIVSRNPDTVMTPDLMVFLKPGEYGDFPKRFTDEVPDLVVEVLSRSISYSRMVQRAERYIRWGNARLMWLVDPDERAVYTCRLKASIQVLDGDDTLTGNGVLPDFACKVAHLFALPGHPPPAQ